jgi:predicted transglutaminase-like cysteine proteinase
MTGRGEHHLVLMVRTKQRDLVADITTQLFVAG